MNTQTAAIPALVITRSYAADPQRVYEAFLSPDALMHWFAPEPNVMDSAKTDPRVGGEYRIAMRHPDGEVFVVEGTYRELKPYERIVFTWQWEEDNGEFGPQHIVALDFAKTAGGCELTLTQTGFASDESREKHTGGWNRCFDGLVKYLSA
jgi:uncharacterized protein YndB with AHSA1/START domain